jgi:Type I restriction enzyme R protein N terminus (HSDR_N)
MQNSSEETLTDYITGRLVPNIGAEANRQMVEKVLVDIKGYTREDIEVGVPIHLDMGREHYDSQLDLVVKSHDRRFMVIKCAAGSLASREREVIAAARLLDGYQLPVAVVSDGRTALVWDTVSGRLIGQELAAIPSPEQAQVWLNPENLLPLEKGRRLRQQLIFRSYDSMDVHRKTI